MNPLEVPAIITEVKTSPDGGLRLKVDVNDIPHEQVAELFLLKGEFLKLTIEKDGT